MADSEEFRRKRIKHEEHLSRVFDEVMGLGDFAESPRGSATSSRSGGQDESREVDETSGQGEHQEAEEDDSSGTKQEEQMDEGVEESTLPCISSSSGHNSSISVRTSEGRGKSGGAAFDDALDGPPMYGPEEEDDEDWHFALPMGSLEDVDADKANKQRRQTKEGNNLRRGGEVGEREVSSESASTSHSSKDHTPDNSQDGGVQNRRDETEDSQQGERSEVAPVEDSNPPVSPSIKIKDEPIDEGYDAALLPQSSIRQIKEELEHHEEELRISSVYSVGGANTFVSPTVPAAIPAPPSAAIFIPGRGTVLQAMASLPVRPPAPSPLQSLVPAPPRLPQPPVVGSVRCSGCLKVLLKGQTAFQRKGSTQLFCSTVCLTGHLPPNPKYRSCFQCKKDILQPRDIIMIPSDDNTNMHFCGQFCLSVFREKKKKQPEKIPDKLADKPLEKPEKPPEKPVVRQAEKPVCSVCRVSKRQIEHEVTHQGRLHRLCSDACFVTWRKVRQLAMNCCEGCGLYCNSNSGSCQTLTIESSQLNFCGPTCISTYKQTCKKTTDCACCHRMAKVSATIMERDHKGKVQLYCSSICVDKCRPPRHTLSGTPFPCGQCKVSAVPQYHLAMVDGTIRNFCSFDCVSLFRKSGQPSPPDQTNGTSSLRDPSIKAYPKPGPSAVTSSVPPIPQDYSTSVLNPGHHPSHTSVPPLVPPYPAMSSPSIPGKALARVSPGQPVKPAAGGLTDVSKLTCHQCSQQFNTKPVLFCHQGRISMHCSAMCCEQYKTQKKMSLLCDGCKQQKVPFDIIAYNQQELVFCSKSCKQLFKHDLTSNNKDRHWRPCDYCSGISQKMLHSHYGGNIKEFCRPHCMSQFTVLYYGMGRCDSCRKQGNMTEKLQCLGSVRNFCNLSCLRQYCYYHFEPNQDNSSNVTETAPQTPHAPAQPHHSSKMNPVIADVVSMANGSAAQPSVSADTTLTGALPTSNVEGKNHDHASTQTDAICVPGSRRRQMKNKSVLCRPFTSDQEIMCQLPTSSTESEALIDSPSSLSTEASASSAQSPKPQGDTLLCNGVPARLTGRHFLGKRESGSDCKVCSQHKRKRVDEEEEQRKKKKMEEPENETVHIEREGEIKEEGHPEFNGCEQKTGTVRGQTSYYCKTCSGEPSLCPVPCFELYHTRLIYKTAPELETQVTSSAKQENVKLVIVPCPVPVFIPVPMNMYSQCTPFPVVMSMPVPVPMFVPAQKKDVKDAAVQSESLAVMDEKENNQSVASADQGSSSENKKSQMLNPEMCEVESAQNPVQTVSSERCTESNDPHPGAQPGAMATSDPPTTSVDHQSPPSSPMMDLETDFPADSVAQKPSAPQRGVKRPREGFSSRKRGRRRTVPLDRVVVETPSASKLNHLYGVKGWKSWVQQRNKQPRESNLVDIKEDILQCDSAELSFALSRFIKEVRRPNGETYSPDSIFYLCLGIQQYLFMKGRIENIFTDKLYNQFAAEITGMLQHWKPKLLPSGDVFASRVEESYLWECKQLGAYSPIVLLNTLLFFCTKNFHFTTLTQHQSLSFVNFTGRSKPCSRGGKVHYLQCQRGSFATSGQEDSERLRKRQAEKGDMEMQENTTNPLRCPVRLYEFYLSRCPESVKKRSDLFYLQPEENVHTHSSHWYTSQPLEEATLQGMLTRILAVKEVHQA